LEVNQATLSRDLRELGVIKVPLGATGSRYVLPGAETSAREQYEETIRRLVLSVEKSGNLLVLKTGPGHAQAACLAVDHLKLEGVVGTVAGDDTFLIVVAEGVDERKVLHDIRSLADLTFEAERGFPGSRSEAPRPR